MLPNFAYPYRSSFLFLPYDITVTAQLHSKTQNCKYFAEDSFSQLMHHVKRIVDQGYYACTLRVFVIALRANCVLSNSVVNIITIDRNNNLMKEQNALKSSYRADLSWIDQNSQCRYDSWFYDEASIRVQVYRFSRTREPTYCRFYRQGVLNPIQNTEIQEQILQIEPTDTEIGVKTGVRTVDAQRILHIKAKRRLWDDDRELSDK